MKNKHRIRKVPKGSLRSVRRRVVKVRQTKFRRVSASILIACLVTAVLSVLLGSSASAQPAMADPVAKADEIVVHEGRGSERSFYPSANDISNGGELHLKSIKQPAGCDGALERDGDLVTAHGKCAPGTYKGSYVVSNGEYTATGSIKMIIRETKELRIRVSDTESCITYVTNPNKIDYKDAASFMFDRGTQAYVRYVGPGETARVWNCDYSFLYGSWLRWDNASTGSGELHPNVLRPGGQLIKHRNGTFTPRLNNERSNLPATYTVTRKLSGSVVMTRTYKVGAQKLVKAPAIVLRSGVYTLRVNNLDGTSKLLDTLRR